MMHSEKIVGLVVEELVKAEGEELVVVWERQRLLVNKQEEVGAGCCSREEGLDWPWQILRDLT